MMFTDRRLLIGICQIFLAIQLCNALPKYDSIGLAENMNQIWSIEQNMDPRADPCNDFYNYACKNWTANNNGEHYSEMNGLMDYKMNKKLIDIFDHTNNFPFEPLKVFYTTCRDSEPRQLRDYLDLVKPDKGLDWPLFRESGETWKADRFNWISTLAKVQQYGIKNLMIEVYILPRDDNSKQFVLDLDKVNFDKDENKLPTKKSMTKTLHKLGLTRTDAMEKATQLKRFENKLKKLPQESELSDDIFNGTVRELESEFPDMPWRTYLGKLLDRPIDRNFKIHVRNKEYFQEFYDFVQHYDQEIVADYIMFKFVKYAMAEETSDFTEIDCMIDVRGKLDLAVNYIYRELYYKEFEKDNNEELYQIFHELQDKYLQRVDENRLNLTKVQRKFLRKKLKAIQLNIGHLPKNVNLKFVKNFYKSVNFSNTSYVHNMLEISKFRFQKECSQMIEPLSDDSTYVFLSSDITRSSGFFYVRFNVIIVPFGNFQTPMFHKNWHRIFKVSLMGFVMAHEISHSIDGSSILFDFEGNGNEDGFDISESAGYTDGINCMSQSETAEIDERIADFVGVRYAYDIFFDETPIRQPQFTEIPLNQLFFLNLAQYFCGNNELVFLDHDADNVRLAETFRNFGPFAKAFNCRKNDHMNPAEKCRIW